MKHIKLILDRRHGSDHLGRLRGETEAKIQLFQNMVMFHFKLKRMTPTET